MCDGKKIKKESWMGSEYEDAEVDNQECQEGEMENEAGEGQQTLKGCCQQLTDLQDKYTHVLADLQNFRQRVDRERVQWSTMAQADVLKKLLPIVDDFDRALQESGLSEDTQKHALVGFTMIYKSLVKMLTSLGVEPIADFTVFDPEKHEAIMQVDAPDKVSESIVAVLEKGYVFKGQVLRPAKVSVAR